MNIDYETGAEVYSIDPDRKGIILLEESIKTLQNYLSYRSPEKYEDFLKGLEKTRMILMLMGVPEYKKRIELLKYTYYCFRLLDDICDGDTLIKIPLEDRKKIIEGNAGIGIDLMNKLGGLGEATRISFNIKDLQEDMLEELINISSDDISKYKITIACLEKLKKGEISVQVMEWIKGEIIKINTLLKEYNERFSLFNLLKGGGIELSFSSNYFRKLFNNLLLKYLILPKGYINGINNVVSKYGSLIKN